MFTVILVSGDKAARSGSLLMNAALFAKAAAAALAALVVSGPKGFSHVESAGALSGSGFRFTATLDLNTRSVVASFANARAFVIPTVLITTSNCLSLRKSACVLFN